MKRLSAAVMLIALLPAALPAQDISVRSGMRITGQAEIQLDRIAEPVTVTLLPGVNPLDAASELCGSVSKTYRKLLEDANPPGAMRISDARRAVVFPACFVVHRNLEVPTIAGESLRAFADRTVGLSGKQTIFNLRQWNAPLRIAMYGSDVDASKLILDPVTTPTLTVPNASEAALYSLRPEVRSNPETAVADLRDAAGLETAPQQVDTKGELWLESDIPGPGTPVPCPATAASAPDANWPFDAAALREALLRNDRHRLEATGSTALDELATLAVADNGLDGFDTVFPRSLFKLQGTGFGHSDYPNDLYGTNVMMRGLQPIVLGGKDPWHGTHMTGLAIGGPAFRKLTEAAGEQPVLRIRLVAISMVEEKTSPTASGINVTTYPMPSDAVNEAFDYALARRVDVLSLSVSTAERQNKLFGKLSGANILLVAAAGNWATHFNTRSQRYPAAYGGVPSRNFAVPVISVAAHDRRGCLASFSGRGDAAVDLAAPGIALLSNDLNGGTRVADGTSQATAITAFAAALVRAEGIRDPMRVKFRLIASADPQPALEGLIFARGTLNIRNAVSVYDDILQLRSESEPDFGTITPRITPAMACSDLGKDDKGEVLKVWRVPGPAPKLRVLIYFANRSLEYRLCDPAQSNFHFESATGRASRDFDILEAANLIPKS